MADIVFFVPNQESICNKDGETITQLVIWVIWSKNIDLSGITVPSGKRLHNYGKPPFLMGKSTINGHFQ